MKPKSKKAAPKKKATPKGKAKKTALRKKTPNTAVRKKKISAPKAAPSKRKKRRSSPRKGIKAPTRRYVLVRATRMPASLLAPLTSDGKPRVTLNPDQIWVENPQGNYTIHTLPYDIQDGDTIWAYNPNDNPYDPNTVPEIETFAVDCYESDGGYHEDVIEYDYTEDYLSVDLSVLEEVVEEPDPQTTGDDPYTCTDDTFSIGIEG